MDKKVDDYIAKLPSPQKEICRAVRVLILEIFPDIGEGFKNGVPWYEERYYIVGLKKQVNIGFAIQGLTPEQLKELEGNGKLMRHVKVRSMEEFDSKREKIVRLLQIVSEAAR